MQLKNNDQQFGAIAKCLHWLIALFILAMLLIGLLSSFEQLGDFRFTLITIHKSLGLTILMLMIVRLLWRYINPPPPYPNSINAFEKRLAHFSHMLLYVAIFAIIVVGWSMSAFGGHQTHFWGLFNVTLPLPENKSLEAIGGTIHLSLAWLIAALLLLHISAAFFHHFHKKDNILKRMLPCQKIDH